MDNLQFLQAILQLGWPAIVLIQNIILYRDNIKMRDAIMDYLKQRDSEEIPTAIVKPVSGAD